MNDDLHNIDDLFRKGIEGHEEVVPPSALEAINNDLDKKQATYFKNKYYRLKRVAAALLLLCFLSGGYLVYKGLKKPNPIATEKKETEVVTPPQALPEETKESRNVVMNRNRESNKERNRAAFPKDSATSKTSIESTNISPSQKQSEQVAIDVEKQESSENSSVVFSSPQHSDELKQFSIARSGLLKKKNAPKYNPYATSNAASKMPSLFSPYLRNIALPDRNYSLFNQLQAPTLNNKFIFPATALSSLKNKRSNLQSFSLTAFAAPNINFNRFEDDDRFSGPGRNRHDAHREERENFSFSGGLLFEYGLLKNWSIQSGITVLSSSTAIDAKTVYAKRDNNGHTRYELHCSSGYVYLSPKSGAQPVLGDSAKTSGTTSHLTYIGIPAAIKYQLGRGRLSFYPSIGVGSNILTSSSASTNLSKGTTAEKTTTSSISGLKPTYLDGHLGLGVEYKLNKKLSIGLRPNARLALTPINKETPVKSYQNFLSVETGVRLKF